MNTTLLIELGISAIKFLAELNEAACFIQITNPYYQMQ